MPTTIDVSIAQGSDDAHESNSVVNLAANVLINLEQINEWWGLRFTGITIPANAVITSAYLTMHFPSNVFDEPDVTFWAQADAAPATFAAVNLDISSRPRTSASVNWGSIDLGAPITVNTADLSSIVQELVDAYAPYVGGAIVFVVRSRIFDGSRDAQIATFEHATEPAAALHIEWEPGDGPGPDPVPVPVGGAGIIEMCFHRGTSFRTWIKYRNGGLAAK